MGGWPTESRLVRAGARPTTAMSDDGVASQSVRPSGGGGGQIDLGFPVCPYFQKKTTVTAATPPRGTKWRRGGLGRGEGREQARPAAVGPLMDLKCCHCADEMRMAKAQQTMESRERGRAEGKRQERPEERTASKHYCMRAVLGVLTSRLTTRRRSGERFSENQ